jgi:hypothetical protein
MQVLFLFHWISALYNVLGKGVVLSILHRKLRNKARHGLFVACDLEMRLFIIVKFENILQRVLNYFMPGAFES